MPSLLRDFSAPVKIHYDYTNEELAWLFQCDSDPFSRSNAGQQLALNLISDLASKPRQEWQESPLIIEACRYLLATPASDLNLLSQLFVLPSVAYILANNPVKDVDAIFEGRNFIRDSIARNLEAEFLKHFREYSNNAPYEYSVTEMGKRKLKNMSLMYLVATQKTEYQKLAFEQFTKTNNMTDAMGALNALNHQASDFREKALEEFYMRWQKEPLVVNKWLQLQATTTLPDALDRVKALLSHSGFNINNPNNVYALICAFGANTVRFHGKNGAGYEFIADQVIKIDPNNPQVAARVIQPLIKWDVVDEARGALMKRALKRIGKQKSLSTDVFEVISKTVA